MLPYQNLSLEDMPGEVWKDIPGFEELYQASSMGRIKAKEKVVRGRYFPEAIVHQFFNHGGYLTCQLSRRSFLVARLVASCFHKRIEGKDFVDHINTNRSDNRYQNLRWVTRKENAHNPISEKRFLLWATSPKSNIGAQSPNARPVVGINLKTSEVRKYDFIKATALDGFTPANVSGCCRGAWKSTLGWKFFYADDPELKSYLPK